MNIKKEVERETKSKLKEKLHNLSDTSGSKGGRVSGNNDDDFSYTKLLTCDMGQLIPVVCDEVVPGDIFKIGNQSVIRMQPLVAPALHEINAYVHYFFRSVSSPLGRMGGLYHGRSAR